MAIELHTGDTLFPHDQFLHDKNILPQPRHLNYFNINPQMQGKLSGNGSNNLESPWDSPNSHDSCWDSTYDVGGMLEKMKLNERESFKHRSGYVIQNLETSKDVGVCSYQSLLQEQIREIQLSQLRQEQILSMKEKLSAYTENHVQISKQFQNKGRGVGVGCDHKRTTPPWHTRSHQQPGSEMPAIFLGSSGSRGTYCGTGVFLPRGRKNVPSESRKRPGKGCSTVLIPARVV
ncbi:uncharacterized protein LOC113865891 [Abrus precatorius]|uniref:Uncharacterized protein LOC113865891 n=1 Tax=Abrus precatorius TaxID=3816 RepID=A0A8B8LJC2_ABRPR|nr:uncharacterized protein LOC113865891 [Abrus precatorius]